ncbi:MAG: hypothetical protein ACK5BR_07985 [Bacteroidota bacterium]
MKKVFAIFAIAGLMAAASCGGKSPEEQKKYDDSVAQAKLDSAAAAETAAAKVKEDSIAAAEAAKAKK